MKNNRSSGVVFYATRQMLQKLSETGIINADVTFKACPEPLEQIHVNFGVFDERTTLVFGISRRENTIIGDYFKLSNKKRGNFQQS